MQKSWSNTPPCEAPWYILYPKLADYLSPEGTLLVRVCHDLGNSGEYLSIDKEYVYAVNNYGK